MQSKSRTVSEHKRLWWSCQVCESSPFRCMCLSHRLLESSRFRTTFLGTALTTKQKRWIQLQDLREIREITSRKVSPNPVQIEVWLDHRCGTRTPVEHLRRHWNDQHQRKNPHSDRLHDGDDATVCEAARQ